MADAALTAACPPPLAVHTYSQVYKNGVKELRRKCSEQELLVKQLVD